MGSDPVSASISAHIDLVRLIYLEERDHIANIRAAADRKGDSLAIRAARASLETIGIREQQLVRIGELGQFLRELEAHHVGTAD